MDEETDADVARGLAPHRQAVLDDAGAGPAHGRRIAGPAGVALAVVLDVVGLHPFEEAADVVLGDVGAEGGVRRLGMEVEVEPEEGVLAGDGGRAGEREGGAVPSRRGRPGLPAAGREDGEEDRGS